MFRASISCYLLLSIFCVASWNCTKIDNTTIGADLLPAVDNVNTFETTLGVFATNFDSSATDCTTIYPESEHALGFINNNPLFGKSQGTIYTELKPGAFPFSFPANTTLDSVVLVLSYRSTYGDTTSSQKVNVFKISNTFNPDSSSCKSYAHEGLPLGSAVYSGQQLNDSVRAFRELSTNQLRIRLDNTFGTSLLSHDSSNAFATDSAFKEILKGFAIEPDSNFGGNSLSYFSLSDTNTKLAVYYRIPNVPDTIVANFRLTFASHSANYVARNHTGAQVAQHQNKPPLGDEEIYIQATPGTQAQIKIPDLSTMSNRIIHRAYLTMDEIYDNSALGNIFATPFILFLDLQDSSFKNGYKPIPCDFLVSSGTPDITSFGGFRTTTKDVFGNNISRYTFNISRYVQKIVTNKRTNSTLRLRAPDIISYTGTGYFDDCGLGVPAFIYSVNPLAFGQVRLGGGNNANYRMILHIVYSNI